MKARYMIRVCGQVQGVGYRYAAIEKAHGLSLCGYVRNEKDGSVSLEVQGDGGAIHTFLRWARRGPTGGRVDSVEFFMQDSLKDYTDFIILRH